ncbi:hypothetical protein [Tenacibaculum aquimarinum]|uniref:hypothetical protein n=1 Tax=Tenacibaculum aquimarinum TaxID=2910675 RepID=UPI001F0AD6C9|nr:hypothetical protein [Tenacibaculum aquimarinum]MCH3883624.1 hypothetical protein [Tenacibaculum aquimarinum]
MKKIICFIILIFIFSCKKEEVKTEKEKNKKVSKKIRKCDLLPTIKSESKINVSLKEISKEIYLARKSENINKIKVFSNSDSIEKILIKKHPKLFIKKDSSLIFKHKNDSTIFLKNRIQSNKSYSDYSIKGSFKNYIFIINIGYEEESTSAINIKNGKVYTFSGKPTFVNDNLFYAYSNYYGDGDSELVFVDVTNEETVLFTFQNIQLNESYYTSNGVSNYIMFKVECLESQEKKYLQILKYQF